LSEPDQSWATKHFNRRIIEIGIERFVTLIAPQQMKMISSWDASARETFKSKLSLFYAGSLEEAKKLLQ
jgi:hypothetical protein